MGGGVLVLLLMALLGSLYQCQSARAKTPWLSADRTTESGVPDGTIKTIEDVEYGVLIDCIDIYKQPSLRHPHLKNHTIQMKPSYPLGQEEATPKGEHFDQPSWSKYGECPEGTIPVIRTRRRLADWTNEAVVPALIVNRSRNDYIRGLECAHVFETVKKYTGVHAHLNLWRPAVEADGQSNARLWLMSSDKSDDIDIISAGWMVDPNWVYPNKTVSIIFWMNNQHQRRGCYNLQCRGFVQTSHTFTLGSPFHRVSTYGGTQYVTQFTIHKDYMTGNWWLRMMNANLGYWPSTLFTILKESAEYVVWGGHVASESGVPGMKHTRTQMGSGHFPNEGFKKACYFRNLSYTTVDTPSLKPPNAKDLHMYVTRPNCYDMKLAEDEEWGVHFYFGGPGFSKKCQRY